MHRLSCILLVVLFELAASAASAQTPRGFTSEAGLGGSLEWERVGETPIDAGDIAFGPDGMLWGVSTELYRLDTDATMWVEVNERSGFHVHPLGPDTLLFDSGSNTLRSLDGGQTLPPVWDEGGALFEAKGPNAGLLLTGAGQIAPDSAGLGYSIDRGASFHRADFALDGLWNREAVAFAELPDGHAHAGRLLAVGVGGLSFSDDGGRHWQPSNVWADLQAGGDDIAVGLDGTAYAATGDGPGPGTYGLWASADGETWAQRSGLGGAVRLFVLADGSAAGALVAVREYDPEGPGVYTSADGGYTWRLLGRVPEDSTATSGSPRMADALLGPEGHLYASVTRTGPARDWVYRTTEPLVLALTTAAEAVPEAVDFALSVRPNPFNPRTVVAFELGARAEVTVAVYDVLGREVARLVDGRTFEAGRHEAAFDGGGLASGRYFVRAVVRTAAGQRRVLSRPFTLLR